MALKQATIAEQILAAARRKPEPLTTSAPPTDGAQQPAWQSRPATRHAYSETPTRAAVAVTAGRTYRTDSHVSDNLLPRLTVTLLPRLTVTVVASGIVAAGADDRTGWPP